MSKYRILQPAVVSDLEFSTLEDLVLYCEHEKDIEYVVIEYDEPEGIQETVERTLGLLKPLSRQCTEEYLRGLLENVIDTPDTVTKKVISRFKRTVASSSTVVSITWIAE